jgi:hypothetical protein
MMRRRSLLRIDYSSSRRRRVALQQRTSISARAGGPFIDLIGITTELNGEYLVFIRTQLERRSKKEPTQNELFEC